MNTRSSRTRQPIRPPSGYEGFLSRRQAATALGFASEFNVRRMEKEGRLRPVRGVMGSAWYPRAQVLALREAMAAAPSPGVVLAGGDGQGPPARWSDAQLIAHLRGRARAIDGGAASRPRTPVDLVADTGISIARAERVYRFWLRHDAHPAAQDARGGAAVPTAAAPAERRSEARVERDRLLRQMRDADPTVRAAAFDKLRALR